MSTSLQTPSHPTPPARRRRVDPRAVAAVAAVLVAAATTGVLIATTAHRPAGEPATAAASPSASPSAPAPPRAGAPTATPQPTATAPPAATNDVDGDGRQDAVSFPAPGTLRIRYATGATNTVTFDADAGDGRLFGIVDADQDGRAEVFVHVGTGAYTDQTSVFRYVDGRLRLVTLDGKQMWLVSGASARHSASWACRPPGTPIVQWYGESDDGGAYHGTLISYRFSGATLVRLSSRPLTVDDRMPAPSGCGDMRT